MSLAIGLDGNGYASWSRTKDGRESKQIAVKISWIDNANIKQPCAFFSHLDFLINSTTVNMLPTKATMAITTRRPFTSLLMLYKKTLDFDLVQLYTTDKFLSYCDLSPIITLFGVFY